jgi:phosphotransferase system enzyme I (PtsI)
VPSRSNEDKREESVIRGVAASPGVAIGPAFIFGDILDEVESRAVEASDVEAEIARFQSAVDTVKEELTQDAARISHDLGQEKADVFLVHSMILEDRMIKREIEKKIRTEQRNAEAVVAEEMKRIAGILAKADDPYLRDRSYDITDIGKRVIERMLGVWAHCRLLQPAVVISRELRASDTVSMDRDRVLGFATELGGKETHAAIFARSLGIPAVVGATDIIGRVKPGDRVIIDGDKGVVILDATEADIARYGELREADRRAEEELKPLAALPSVTSDGVPITLMANIRSAEEAEGAERLGADGIGLFRTESVFMAANQFLGENEQYEIYRTAAAAMKGKPVIIRTLDIGGDKFVGPENPLMEQNPHLGYRSIRLFLDHPEPLVTQMRAILRAGRDGDVRILWPMISSVEELIGCRELLARTAGALRSEGVPFREDIPAGVMVEVPSAAVIADRLAERCDFLSIGTNDLVQYALAVDRGNVYVDRLYRPHHPAILSLIERAVEGASRASRPIALCGEMAGVPEYVPLLIGLGLRELSVSTRRLLRTRKSIREAEAAAAAVLARRAVDASTATEVAALLGIAESETAAGLIT